MKCILSATSIHATLSLARTIDHNYVMNLKSSRR